MEMDFRNLAPTQTIQATWYPSNIPTTPSTTQYIPTPAMHSQSSSSSSTSASTSQSSSKNWESSFGKLSSSFGFGGSAPSLPSSNNSKTKVPKQHQPAYQAQVQSPAPGQKNYEAAFGNLSSSYGFGGGPVPAPSVPRSEKKTKAPKPSPTYIVHLPQSQSQSAPQPHPTKNYEESFAQLQSSYGFGGGVPVQAQWASR